MQFRKIFMLVMLFAPSAFAKEYTNSQYGLNFTLPDNWKITEFEDLSSAKQERLKKYYNTYQTLAIWSNKDIDNLNRLTVLFQFHEFQKMNYNGAIKELKSENGKKMMLIRVKSVASDAIGKEFKFYREVDTDSYFDSSVPMAYALAAYQCEDKPDLMCITASLIVNEGVVAMLCFSQGTQATNFVNTIDAIIDSFYYDDGNVEENYEESDRSSGKRLHWLVPTLALCVFVFLLQRWASR